MSMVEPLGCVVDFRLREKRVSTPVRPSGFYTVYERVNPERKRLLMRTGLGDFNMQTGIFTSKSLLDGDLADWVIIPCRVKITVEELC